MTTSTHPKGNQVLKVGNDLDLNSTLTQLLNNKINELLPTGLPTGLPSSVSTSSRQKRLNSERNNSSESESEDDQIPPRKASKGNAGSSTPGASTSTGPTNQPKDYATQVVILTSVDENVKKHPSRLSQAFAKTKPNVELRNDGLRLTASGDVLVKPNNPKDCNSLLKENAFPSTCDLGKDVKARLPKSQQITHQFIITNVDVEVTQEEMEEILHRQSLPFKMVKRIHSRARDAPTKMIRLIVNDEATKKRLLRDGINLDQAHFKCILSHEDSNSFPKVTQCFRCQQLGDHLSGTCKKEQKCVLCSGPHRKSECTETKENFCCANCSGCHAAWSLECPKRKEAVNLKTKPTMAQVASATVTPSTLQDVLQEIKQEIVMVIAEVISRSICELVFEIMGKSLSKATLPLKVASISTMTVNAANKLKFGGASKPIEASLVKENIIKKCFPERSPEATAQDPKSSSQTL